MMLTSQQQAEIDFWRGEFKRRGSICAYLMARRQDLQIESEYLPEVLREAGCGLDVGCGLVSVLEFLPTMAIVHAVDPLLHEYEAIFQHLGRTAYYSGTVPPVPFDGHYDFAWCVNVIDHDPDPDGLLAKIHAALKPGGRFYFWVNFDPELYAPHYSLWTMETVNEKLKAFHLQRGTVYWSDTWKKYIWSALYLKK